MLGVSAAQGTTERPLGLTARYRSSLVHLRTPLLTRPVPGPMEQPASQRLLPPCLLTATACQLLPAAPTNLPVPNLPRLALGILVRPLPLATYSSIEVSRASTRSHGQGSRALPCGRLGELVTQATEAQ